MTRGFQPTNSDNSLFVSFSMRGKKLGNLKKRKEIYSRARLRFSLPIILMPKWESQWFQTKDTCLLSKKVRQRFRYRALKRRGYGR